MPAAGTKLARSSSPTSTTARAGRADALQGGHECRQAHARVAHWRVRCASSPARRTGCCSSWPPSSRAAAGARAAAEPGRGRGPDRRRGLRGRARRAAPTPRPRPGGYAALGPDGRPGWRARARDPRRGRGAVRRRQSALRPPPPDRRDRPRGRPSPRWSGSPRPRARRRQRGRRADRRHLALPLLRGQPRVSLRPRGGVGHAAGRAGRREGVLEPGEPRGGAPRAHRRPARRPRPRRPRRRAARRPGRREAALGARASAATGEREGAVASAAPGLEPVRLADSDWLVPEADDAGGPDAVLPGFGNTMRDGLGVRAERGGVEIAIVGGLLFDPVLGVRRTSLGVPEADRRDRPGRQPRHDGRRRGRARHRHRGARRDRPRSSRRAPSTRTCTGCRRRSRTPRWPAASPRS